LILYVATCIYSVVLTLGQAGQFAGAQWAQGPDPNLCMLCTAWLLMLKHWFCWTYQYNKYMFNFIDNYSFIHASSCLGIWAQVHCFARGPIMQLRWPWLYMYLQKHIVTYTYNMEIISDITVTKCTDYIFFRDCVSSTSSNM
jgi:hypothetical protein